MLRCVAMALVLACTTTSAFAQKDGGVAGTNVEPLTSARVAAGLVRPIFATYAPGDYTRLFIIEKQGRIRILNLKTFQLQPIADAFLNIDSVVGGGTSANDERGLLGLAFHPEYQDNGKFYVYYTNNSSDTNIAEYTAASPDQANPTGNVIMFIDQPYTNHNGGWIGFGPLDNYLYIGTGDGGSFCDPGNRAQDVTNQLLGKMLRVDVNGDDFPSNGLKDYAIPADNPFVGVTGDDEIWSYGLRNPWRNCFDRDTGDLYIADVGQGQREEIDFQPADSPGGENYGWDCKEGLSCSSISGCSGFGCNCATVTAVDPFQWYSHSSGCSITGGYIYRGCAIPTLDGHYFYSDYCSSSIWSLTYDGSSVSNFTNRTSELDPPGSLSISSVASFGEDARGELYVCDQNGGEVFQIRPVTPTISSFDLNCSGAVDVEDLVAIILAWGDCVGCIEDTNGDDAVNVEDLVNIIVNWG
ncbi:MAG: PQQ-dependent sugar dehydrogenase [Planctomycetota bacterium]